MPSCSWLLAPRSQVVPNEPDSKTCAFLRGRPVRTCLAQRRFRWARGWADFIAKKAQLLGGSMARCRFRYYSYNQEVSAFMVYTGPSTTHAHIRSRRRAVHDPAQRCALFDMNSHHFGQKTATSASKGPDDHTRVTSCCPCLSIFWWIFLR